MGRINIVLLGALAALIILVAANRPTYAVPDHPDVPYCFSHQQGWWEDCGTLWHRSSV